MSVVAALALLITWVMFQISEAVGSGRTFQLPSLHAHVEPCVYRSPMTTLEFESFQLKPEHLLKVPPALRGFIALPKSIHACDYRPMLPTGEAVMSAVVSRGEIELPNARTSLQVASNTKFNLTCVDRLVTVSAEPPIELALSTRVASIVRPQSISWRKPVQLLRWIGYYFLQSTLKLMAGKVSVRVSECSVFGVSFAGVRLSIALRGRVLVNSFNLRVPLRVPRFPWAKEVHEFMWKVDWERTSRMASVAKTSSAVRAVVMPRITSLRVHCSVSMSDVGGLCLRARFADKNLYELGILSHNKHQVTFKCGTEFSVSKFGVASGTGFVEAYSQLFGSIKADASLTSGKPALERLSVAQNDSANSPVSIKLSRYCDYTRLRHALNIRMLDSPRVCFSLEGSSLVQPVGLTVAPAAIRIQYPQFSGPVVLKFEVAGNMTVTTPKGLEFGRKRAALHRLAFDLTHLCLTTVRAVPMIPELGLDRNTQCQLCVELGRLSIQSGEVGNLPVTRCLEVGVTDLSVVCGIKNRKLNLRAGQGRAVACLPSAGEIQKLKWSTCSVQSVLVQVAGGAHKVSNYFEFIDLLSVKESLNRIDGCESRIELANAVRPIVAFLSPAVVQDLVRCFVCPVRAESEISSRFARLVNVVSSTHLAGMTMRRKTRNGGSLDSRALDFPTSSGDEEPYSDCDGRESPVKADHRSVVCDHSKEAAIGAVISEKLAVLDSLMEEDAPLSVMILKLCFTKDNPQVLHLIESVVDQVMSGAQVSKETVEAIVEPMFLDHGVEYNGEVLKSPFASLIGYLFSPMSREGIQAKDQGLGCVYTLSSANSFDFDSTRIYKSGRFNDVELQFATWMRREQIDYVLRLRRRRNIAKDALDHRLELILQAKNVVTNDRTRLVYVSTELAAILNGPSSCDGIRPWAGPKPTGSLTVAAVEPSLEGMYKWSGNVGTILGPRDIASILVKLTSWKHLQVSMHLVLQFLMNQTEEYMRATFCALSQGGDPMALATVMTSILSFPVDTTVGSPISAEKIIDRIHPGYRGTGDSHETSIYKNLQSISYLLRFSTSFLERYLPTYMLFRESVTMTRRLIVNPNASFCKTDLLSQEAISAIRVADDVRFEVSAYEAAFSACERVIKSNPESLQAEWLRVFFKRNFTALTVVSVLREIRQGKGHTWLLTNASGLTRESWLSMSDTDLSEKIIRALYPIDSEEILSDPLVSLRIRPAVLDFNSQVGPSAPVRATVVLSMGIITKGINGTELADTISYLESTRPVRFVRANTGTGKSIEYNARKVIMAIKEVKTTNWVWLGYSQGCANTFAAEGIMLRGTPEERDLIRNRLKSRMLLYGAHNGSIHGDIMRSKVVESLRILEEAHKFSPPLASFVRTILASGTIQESLGGLRSISPQGLYELWTTGDWERNVPTFSVVGACDAKTTPDFLRVVSAQLSQLTGGLPFSHDSQIEARYALAKCAVPTTNTAVGCIEECSVNTPIQRTHHWSPLYKESAMVFTRNDKSLGIFDIPKHRHIEPWIDCLLRFGII